MFPKKPTEKMLECLVRQGRLCPWCGGKLFPDYLSREHFIPTSMGGTFEGYNAVVAHEVCNFKRSSDLTVEVHANCKGYYWDKMREILARARKDYFRQQSSADGELCARVSSRRELNRATSS